MSRRKIWIKSPLDLEVTQINIIWGDYAFLIYYASKIDILKTLTLIRLLRGESQYEMALDLPFSDSDPSLEKMVIAYNNSFLLEAINFLNDDIIPALIDEPEYMLIDKYEGVEGLEDLILSDPEPIIEVVSVFGEWYTMSLSTQAYIDLLTSLKNTFELIRESGLDYTVYAKI